MCVILASLIALFILQQRIAGCGFGHLLQAQQTLNLDRFNTATAHAAPVSQSHASHAATVPRITMEQELAAMDDVAKQDLWYQLTKQVKFKRAFWKSNEPFDNNTGRLLVDNFDKFAAKDLAPDQICGELGDGHFLHRDFKRICKSILALDHYDPRANVKLDLNVPPQQAPEKVKAFHGTLTLLVSHQVFEHLKRPSVGMANANALLQQQGRYIFTTPFVTKDHRGPGDFYRFTVPSVYTMLKCSGFHVEVIRGLGNRRTNLAYLAEVPADMIMPHDAAAFCDGLANGTTDKCRDQYYSIVGATATKVKDVSLADIQNCFG